MRLEKVVGVLTGFYDNLKNYDNDIINKNNNNKNIGNTDNKNKNNTNIKDIVNTDNKIKNISKKKKKENEIMESDVIHLSD